MADLACPTCGSLNAPTRTFCWKCAADLRAVVPDPTAPPPPPRVEVPIRPLLIGGGVALGTILLIALAVVLLSGSPAATPSPSLPASPSAGTPGGIASPTASLAPVASPTVAPATPAPTPTPAPPATPRITPIPAPTILSFTGPKTVDCADQSYDGFITLSWEVAYADSTELAIDFPGVYKSYPGVAGTDRVPFSCGNGSHTYTLTTVGGNGPAASKTLTITDG
jgi:hypothetical protein